MLEKYKDVQPLFFEEVENFIKNDKISHAYLIETNSFPDSNGLVMSFVKEIFSRYVNSEDEMINISNLIDNNTFSDFIFISSEDSNIKKDQILDLQEKFKTTSVDNRPRIYVIEGVDKLNKYSANSLLKFLEEPEGNLIAILVTDNRYKVLETIRSRCQIYSLKNTKSNDDYSKELIESTVDIIKILEEKKEKTIAHLPIYLEGDYKNRDFWVNSFNIMIDIYDNCIRKSQNNAFYDYGDILDLIISNNDLSKIIYKMKVLFEILGNLEFNINISMMLDSFIIKFNGGD